MFQTTNQDLSSRLNNYEIVILNMRSSSKCPSEFLDVCRSVTRDDLWIGWRKHLDRKPSMLLDPIVVVPWCRLPWPTCLQSTAERHNPSRLLPDDLLSFLCLLQNQWEPEKSGTCKGKDWKDSTKSYKIYQKHLLRHLPFSQFSESMIYLQIFFWAQWFTLWYLTIL